MRLQLDSTSAGGPGGVGQATPISGSGSSANRVGPGSSGSGDSIQISGASSVLNRLAADRAAQIQQLTSAVQSGSYQVSSSLVGNAIVEHGIT
jgi:anti-sigma28 factor (negative regulator of flagellin synthesis)